MNSNELTPQTFRQYAHEIVDWIADFLENIETYPVKSSVAPKEIYDQLPDSPPQHGESMRAILDDFERIILPGMTHWQHPNFFAFFPANSSYPSLLAEMLTAALAAQCMIWETSPAAAELEERVMNWLKEMCGLPANWEGVIQDTASTATLCAILTARERFSDFKINQKGFENGSNFRVYASNQTHSSIDKAVKIAGIGQENLVKVGVLSDLSIDPAALEQAIENDQQQGRQPLCVVLTLGTTSTTAIDRIASVVEICHRHRLWLHIDAAFAGTALLLPEYRSMIEGIEGADSFVFNPHKWMFTNFDCTAYFVKDRAALLRTFSILPEYLKTATRGQVNDYRDWGVPLGRRFRALKLWFVIRNFGVEGLQRKLRHHIELAKNLEATIAATPDFEVIFPRTLNAVFFRLKPQTIDNQEVINNLNEQLLQQLNATGQIYLTHTKVQGLYLIRMVIGQTNVAERHVEQAWALIQDFAKRLEIPTSKN